jgi:hypothetical protein
VAKVRQFIVKKNNALTILSAALWRGPVGFPDF